MELKKAIVKLKPGKYVVAVSGGVDSMVLLHLLSSDSHLQSPDSQIIVAHFDHGIRQDSSRDKKLVEATAKKLGLTFEFEEGKLGKSASEAAARSARYDFLKRVKLKYGANAILTAHHQNDAVETLLINMIRGTGRRGVLSESNGILRPLLNEPKTKILEYAQKHQLKWRDDPSNADIKYLRNYVRQILIPKLEKADPEVLKKLITASSSLKRVNTEIDQDLLSVMEEECKFERNQVSIPRHWLIMIPNEVGKEVIYSAIRHLDMDSGVDKKRIASLLMFAKTGKVGKLSPVNKLVQMRIQPSQVLMEMV